MVLNNDKLYHFVSNYYSLNRFTCIPDSATMFICRMITFSHLYLLLFITIISLVLLIEKQYEFEE